MSEVGFVVQDQSSHRPDAHLGLRLEYFDEAAEEGQGASQHQNKRHKRPKAKLRYIGNHPILGASLALEKEIRAKARAEAIAAHTPPSWLVQDDAAAMRMPPRRHTISPTRYRPFTKEEETQRRMKLLGLPMSYLEPPFSPSEARAPDRSSCFSPESLSQVPQAAPSVRLPALESSGRIALVSSMNSGTDPPHEEHPHADCHGGVTPQMLDVMCSSPTASISHMDQLREERQRIRRQRHQQQAEQAAEMIQRLFRLEQEAKERETRRARVRTIESAQLWVTYKMAQEGFEEAFYALPHRERAVLTDSTPPPHAALLVREDSSSSDGAHLTPSPGRRSPSGAMVRHRAAAAVYCHRRPGAHRHRDKSPAVPSDHLNAGYNMDEQVKELPTPQREVIKLEIPTEVLRQESLRTPPEAGLLGSVQDQIDTGCGDSSDTHNSPMETMTGFVRSQILDLWRNVGLPLPTDPTAMFTMHPKAPS